MRLRHRLSAAALLLLSAGSALGQAQPKIWTFRPPLGTAATDARFTPFVHYSMRWGIYDSALTSPIQPLVDRGSLTVDGSATGERIAQEVKDRFASNADNIAVSLTSLGWERVEGSGGYNTGVAGHLGYLYAHPNDEITYGLTNKKRRGLAMQYGAAWMTDWMYGFVDGYKAEIGSSWETEFVPQRFIFDQEIGVIGVDMLQPDTIGEWADYWAVAKNDVPYGFADTLDNLLPYGVNVPTTPSPSWSYQYVGGSADNQAFFEWWRGICMQAYANVMEDAVYTPLRNAYGSALFSDYENSLWLDGGPSVNNPSAAANVSIEHGYYGSTGPRGVVSTFAAPGDNLQQAPHLYPDWSWYAMEFQRQPYPTPTGTVNPPFTVATDYYSSEGAPLPYSYSTPYGNTPFLISDDENAGLSRPMSASRYAFGYQEYWGDYNIRMNRASLDALVRSFPSTSGKPPIAPWVSLPNQPWLFAGDGGSAYPMIYDGRSSYSGNMLFRQSLAYTYRVLGLVHSRGCDEMFVWNDYGPADPSDTDSETVNSYNRYGPHAQFDSTWSEFARAVDEVWGYPVYSFAMSGATYGANNDPTDATSTNATRIGQLAKCEAAADKSGTIELTSTTPGGGTPGTRAIWTATYFNRTVTEATNPDILEIDAEVIVNQECTLTTYVLDWPSNVFRQVGSGSGQLPEVEGRAPTITLRPGLNRVHLSVPWNADYFNSSNRASIGFYAMTTSSSTTQQLVENIDYIQIYARYDVRRPRGDYNGDGVANSIDTDTWAAAYDYVTDSLTAGSDRAAFYRRFLDLNNDAAVDLADLVLWGAYFDPSSGTLAADPAEDDHRPMYEPR